MMRELFQYTPGDTLIHRLNPLIKILVAVSICAAAFLGNNLLFLVFLLLLDVLIGFAAGIPAKTLSILKGLSKVCLFLFILQALFVRSGKPVLLFITDEGLLLAAKVALRLMIACVPLALMLAVTQVSDIANSMVSVLHLPYKYAFTLTTTIRFIPQFMEEMSDIMEAQTARGVEFDAQRGIRKIGMVLPLCVPLLISSVRRTDATAVAAEVRGFELRTAVSGYKKYPFHAADLAVAAACVILIAAGVLL